MAVELSSVAVEQLLVLQGEQQLPINDLSLSAQLQGQSLRLSSLSASSANLNLAGDLSLLLAGLLPLDAELNWRYSQSLYPESGPASGNLQVSGDLGTLQIRHQLQQPAVVNTQGTVETGITGKELTIDLSHVSQTIEVPQSAIEGLQLSISEMITQGNLNSMRIALTATAEGGQLPTTTLALESAWQGDSLIIRNLQLATTGGSFSSTGELVTGEVLSGNLRFQLTDPAPLDYLETDLPLQVANLASSGTVSVQPAGKRVSGNAAADGACRRIR